MKGKKGATNKKQGTSSELKNYNQRAKGNKLRKKVTSNEKSKE